MLKISVIVPVYNVEKYLNRCVDSIINQNYSNLEIILVDDGSTDNSPYICDDYENKDERIKVIHKKNGGLSSARNKGLEIASGDYISFVDSDDWIAEDIYEYCINLLEEKLYDIVDFKCVFSNGEPEEIYKEISSADKILKDKEILQYYLLMGQKEKAPFSVCRKLYKKEVFNGIKFPEGKINEDIATNYKVLMNCNNMVSISKIGYFYYQNTNSITTAGLKKRDFDLISACDELNKLVANEEYGTIKYLAKIKTARSYFSLLAKVAFYGIDDEELKSSKVIKELTVNLRKNYFLLMKSPVPFNRKIMISVLCINFKCLSIPLSVYKKIRR